MKHEKYIQEKKNAKGEVFFRIYIPYKNEYGVAQKPISENVKVRDFESAKVALSVAVLKRNEYLKKIDEETYVPKSKYPTVQELWDKKFEYIVRSKRTKDTHLEYWNGGICKLADKQINKIITADLQKNVNDYAKDHSQRQISIYVSCWRDLYRLCNMLDIPVQDKTQAISVPKSKIIKEPSPVDFSNEDFFKLVNILNNMESKKPSLVWFYKMIRFMLLIGYYTGMRPAEILALNAEDITENEIKVWKSVGSTETEEVAIITTKTPQSIRNVPIHEDLKPILEELKKMSPYSPLITEMDGSLINICKISKKVYTICKKNNIHFHLYCLRHAFATGLVRNGVNPRTTQDLMGHASFSMSIEYARSTEEDRNEAIQNLKKDKIQ